MKGCICLYTLHNNTFKFRNHIIDIMYIGSGENKILKVCHLSLHSSFVLTTRFGMEYALTL